MTEHTHAPQDRGVLVGYARPGPAGSPTVDDQVAALTAAGCAKVFTDDAAAGRPAGPRESVAALGRGDVLVVTSLDRLGLRVPEVLALVADLTERGGSLRVLDLDGDVPRTWPVLRALAHSDRTVHAERTKVGLARARQEGRVGGRPPRMSVEQMGQARRWFEQDGLRPPEIARRLGVSERTVRRRLGLTGPGTDVARQEDQAWD